ncbi:unnamed protein product [Pleuronectes platessa]|uniref:Uncharacterized protein n=1 Tax=Pleuronectes platessa TaxID=8262 RepID=A0A9N7Y8Y3_PLEPL|nr:unnamed protein product [Pleuronectes platessa]
MALDPDPAGKSPDVNVVSTLRFRVESGLSCLEAETAPCRSGPVHVSKRDVPTTGSNRFGSTGRKILTRNESPSSASRQHLRPPPIIQHQPPPSLPPSPPNTASADDGKRKRVWREQEDWIGLFTVHMLVSAFARIEAGVRVLAGVCGGLSSADSLG